MCFRLFSWISEGSQQVFGRDSQLSCGLSTVYEYNITEHLFSHWSCLHLIVLHCVLKLLQPSGFNFILSFVQLFLLNLFKKTIFPEIISDSSGNGNFCFPQMLVYLIFLAAETIKLET